MVAQFSKYVAWPFLLWHISFRAILTETGGDGGLLFHGPKCVTAKVKFELTGKKRGGEEKRRRREKRREGDPR